MITSFRSLFTSCLRFIGVGSNPFSISYTGQHLHVRVSSVDTEEGLLTQNTIGDMEQLGRYYSHTLLNAMLSHSVRWCKNDARIRQLLSPYDDGNLFSRQARTLLFEELMLGQCTVPTVQTLLLLSAQECSAGNRTQAWLYSGMAFRLIEDMGICIDGQKYASTVKLSDEDIEIRHRLFWSCYFWDKLISLYLGRSPTLQHSTVSPPQIMCKFYDNPFILLFSIELLFTFSSQWTIQRKPNSGHRTE
jgi:hypothetical protein